MAKTEIKTKEAKARAAMAGGKGKRKVRCQHGGLLCNNANVTTTFAKIIVVTHAATPSIVATEVEQGQGP